MRGGTFSGWSLILRISDQNGISQILYMDIDLRYTVLGGYPQFAFPAKLIIVS